MKMSLPLPLIDFQNVTVLRGGRPVLRSLSLQIPIGQNVAIFGPNGSGKSTLIKAMTRECYPVQSRGASFRIFGQEVWNVFNLRGLLGIVDNDLEKKLDRTLSAREVLLTGFFSSLRLWPHDTVTAAMESKIRKILHLLGIAALAQRKIGEMSSGEVRRTLIGRALVHDPRALVLDEPTNSLDWRAVAEFKQALRRIADSGKSIIVVTHHLDDLIPEIDRVILLKEGRVFMDGPTARVLTSKNVSRLFGIPIRLSSKPLALSASRGK